MLGHFPGKVGDIGGAEAKVLFPPEDPEPAVPEPPESCQRGEEREVQWGGATALSQSPATCHLLRGRATVSALPDARQHLRLEPKPSFGVWKGSSPLTSPTAALISPLGTWQWATCPGFEACCAVDTAQLLGDISLRRERDIQNLPPGAATSPKAPESASVIEGKTKKWGDGRAWTLFPWCQQDSPKTPSSALPLTEAESQEGRAWSGSRPHTGQWF